VFEGVLFLVGVALAIAFPFVVMSVVPRLAARRRKQVAEPLPEGRPRLSVPAFASGLLWLFPLPMLMVSRDVLDRLIRSRLLPGPTHLAGALGVIVATALLGLVLGIISLYQIARRPDQLRGRGYALVGIFCCWWAAVVTGVFGLPRAQTSDRVERLCGRNVAGLAAAVRTYVDDHQGKFPASGQWWDSVLPYLAEDVPGGTPTMCAYVFNSALSGRRLDELADPSAVVTVFDGGFRGEQWTLEGERRDLPDTPTHVGGDNYGFADGHHRWLPRRKLGPRGSATVWAKGTDADWVQWEP